MTAVVINQLREILCRNGFPTMLVSHNGPKFCSKNFKAFLKQEGITHVKALPYHPQGNGLMEMMHRTLKEIVVKTVDKKGNWPTVVPMALYFMRANPCT